MMQVETDSTTPRIYVASLADYTADRLLGRWIDAAQSVENIHREIAEMLAESKEPIAEEWAIHGYENFGSLRLSEFEDLAYVAGVADGMREHGTLFAEVVAHSSDIEEARRYMEEGYCGAFDRLGDYSQESIEDAFSAELEQLPEFIRHYIDYEGIAHDMELSGDVFAIEHGGKVHVFSANI